jgi:hypothetical protein
MPPTWECLRIPRSIRETINKHRRNSHSMYLMNYNKLELLVSHHLHGFFKTLPMQSHNFLTTWINSQARWRTENHMEEINDNGIHHSSPVIHMWNSYIDQSPPFHQPDKHQEHAKGSTPFLNMPLSPYIDKFLYQNNWFFR